MASVLVVDLAASEADVCFETLLHQFVECCRKVFLTMLIANVTIAWTLLAPESTQ